MNLGDLWQEHKKFITTVLVGAFVVLIAQLVMKSIYSSKVESHQREISSAQAAQRSATLPGGVDLKKIQQDREQLRKEFDSLVASVSHTPTEPFRLGGNVTDPDLHYNSQVDRLRTGILELAAIRNIDVDQRLGLPDAFPASRGEIEHYLRGLDVVEEMISMCIAAEQLYEGGVARIERIEIEKANKNRAANDRKVPFTTSLRVNMVVVGHPKAADWILRRFPTAASDDPSRAGRYLAVDEASIRSLDTPPGAVSRDKRGSDPADRRRVELRLSVLALAVNTEGQAR